MEVTQSRIHISKTNNNNTNNTKNNIQTNTNEIGLEATVIQHYVFYVDCFFSYKIKTIHDIGLGGDLNSNSNFKKKHKYKKHKKRNRAWR